MRIFFIILFILCFQHNSGSFFYKKNTAAHSPIKSILTQNHLLNVDSLLTKKSYLASNGLQLPYRFFNPKITDKKSPLVIFLHGRGNRGTDNGSHIYKEAGFIMNENSILKPSIQKTFPCFVLVPQCSDKTENEEWAKWVGNSPETPFKGLRENGSYTLNPTPSSSGEATLELIEKLISEFNIDPNRIYLIGLSMGGFGTWEFTSRKPNLFAAAIPMAGYSDPNQIEKIKHIPFWIFHGEIDKWNPVEGSRNMYSLLKKENADVKYTEYKNTGHGEAFKKAFIEPDLLSWLFSKSKKQLN